MPEAGLCVEGLSVAFGPVRALDDVGFAVAPGAALGLVGESGSGKSTAVLALLGLLDGARVAARRMAFDGADLLVAAPALRGRRIGVVFRDPSSTLNPALTVGSQVAEPLLVHARLTRTEAWAQATALLAETGLSRAASLMKSYPHQLSGGMKQRVAIAMALASRPELLLLDEPTTALDVTVEAGILDMLEALRARRSLSLLLVSHNLGIVDRLCDRVTVLYAGRVVEAGPVRDVLGQARHPYARGLLAALPRIDRPGVLAPIPGGLPDLTRPDPGCNFRPRCPFVAAGCESAQVLSGAKHQVRCHRAEAIAGLPWPTPSTLAHAPR
ncbi:MAG: ABC transporter ATP-binding protein, partial [Acetobacteraceae bacterium]